VTIRRIIAGLGSILLLLPMVAAWQHHAVPWSLRDLSAVLFAASVVSPLTGLIGFILSLPLATPWQIFSGAPLPSGAEPAEMMLLPFLSGACLRLAFDRQPVRSRLAAPAAVLGVAIVASAIWRLFILQVATAFPDDFVRDLWQHFTLNYFIDPQRYTELHAATAWVEALVLAVTGERILRRHPSAARGVLGALIVGGVESSVWAVTRFFQVVGRRGGTFSAAWNLLSARERFHTQFKDINAEGSYFALYSTPALYLLLKRRWWVFIALPPLLLALWHAGSRSALASVVIGVLVAWTLSRPNVSWPRVAAVLSGGLALAIYAALKSSDLQMPADSALAYRQEFASIALRMTRDNPWFGVGITQFRHSTMAYLAADNLETLAPFGGENAHNNFLQILGELGITGFLAFMWLLARPATDLWHAARARAATLPMTALAAGVIAFLMSALGGHPLLTTQVQFAFFLIFGVFAGTIPARQLSASGDRIAGWVAFAAVALLALSLPFRLIETRRLLTLPRLFFGASEIHDSIDGLVYRVADRRSAWFVLSSEHSVDIPLRWTADSSASCSVTVRVDGRVVNHLTPRADQWLHTVFNMADVPTRNNSRRFDLEVQGEGCTLMVAPLVTHQ
jgi:O-antigen ligase